MVKALTKDGWKRWSLLGKDPVFFCAPKRYIVRERKPRAAKVYPSFPPIFPHEYRGFEYRLAVIDDLDAIIELVDRLLAGRDFFCPRGQHIGYFKYKTILLCLDQAKLIGWSVRQLNGSLIHLLVDTDYRGNGIGSHLLELLQPLLIRSKSDQSTGDPLSFYQKHGYQKTSDDRVGKNKNIDLLSRSDVCHLPQDASK